MPDPKPVSPSLEQHFRDSLAKIPASRKLNVGLAVTTLGVEGHGGWTINEHGTLVGWGGWERKTKEVSAGIRTEWSW